MWRRRLQDESGSVLVLTAIMLVVLLGFVALVIDGGRLYSEKAQLQKALDAAALSGAQLLIESETQAVSTAISVAGKNGYTIDSTNIEILNGDTIRVSQTVQTEMTFARVIGFEVVDVSAVAAAKIGVVVRHPKAIPVWIPDINYVEGGSYLLNKQSSINGNFGYLAVSGNGANVLKNAIINGVDISINRYYNTEPGHNWGPVSSAFEHRFIEDQTKSYCQSFDTATYSCKRVVIVPIIESGCSGNPDCNLKEQLKEQLNGRSPIKVIGLAAFWLESISESSEKEITARFIKVLTEGDIGNGPDYGVKSIQLIE